MGGHLQRAQVYHDRIRQVLLHEWDPIGVSDDPDAQDEYDSYIGQLYTMLIRHEARHVLIDHLWTIETVTMGLAANRSHTEAVAESLINVRDSMERDL